MNEIICGDNLSVMKEMKDNCIDLTVTSPPYDDLRTYNNNIDKTWGEDVWKPIIKELYRVTKKGGVVVWVVGDRTKNGCESGTSFKQALWFMECGFRLFDTMIYQKNGPAYPSNDKYFQIFEYMFIFSKDKVFTFNPIEDRFNKWYGKKFSKTRSRRKADGTVVKTVWDKEQGGQYGKRFNIWKYNVGAGYSTKDKIAFKHPAMFPEKLAEDHIISWSNEGDTVLDPFVGSGTTPKMAKKLGRRYIGIDISEEYCELARERIKLMEEGEENV